MSFAAGDRLGPYEIVSPLGEGGMGEVYRARDRKLNRDVALKVLPQRFALDGERLARFKREAETLAALSHPNIAVVHTIEDSVGSPAIVLELVEGPTLADLIARGPLPLDHALAIASQIAEALDAAHGRGIVHRDLKPANIKVRPDGAVKVLDFGLAKLTSREETRSDTSGTEPHALTFSGGATVPGAILGTPAYMSPEQARGEIADSRTDVWAFGVVMFEMLTGRPLFGRPNMADTVAAVLQSEPDWNRIPHRVRPLLRSCLQKDARLRLRDMGDARLLIGDEGQPAHSSRSRTVRLAWGVAAVATSVAIAAIWAPWERVPPEPSPVRFHIVPSVTPAASGASAVSPDGRRLAFLGTGIDGVLRVWVRDLDSLVDRPLTGSEVGQAAPPPFWSPDSRFIAFDAGGALKTIEAAGGLAQTLCAVPAPVVGGSWNRDGTIIFGLIGSGIQRVPAAGGTPEPVTTVDRAQGEFSHLAPVFLPDGRRFLYLRILRNAPERTGIFSGSLDRAADQQEHRRILQTTTSVSYVATGANEGTLLFLRDGNLLAQTFDERRLEPTGETRLVAEGVESYLDGATMSASANGVLVYRDAPSFQLAWFDRQGRGIGRVPETGLYQSLTLSDDGARALVSGAPSHVTSAKELWLFDFARETRTRIAGVETGVAIWSRDSSRFIYDASDGLQHMVMDRSQAPTTLLPPPAGRRRTPTSWSPDGRYVMFTVHDPATGSDLFAVSLDDVTEIPFLHSEAAENQGQFSPDTRGPLWVAYTSNESGRDEVFVRQFPGGQGRVMVSRGGGHSPRWRADGRELFYIAADGTVTAAAFLDSRLSPPVPLFKAPPGFGSRDATGLHLTAPWDVTPDGQRFLFAAPTAQTGVTPFTVVLNWQSDQAR